MTKPWQPARGSALPWRDYLTEEEAAELAAADAAKAEWQRLNRGRALIQNRAIHRAKAADQVARAALSPTTPEADHG